MSAEVCTDSTRTGGTVARATALLSIFLSVLALIGWQLNIEVFRSLRPGLVAMNPATAVAFILASASLWLQISDKPWRSARRLGQILAAAVLTVGLLKLAGILFAWNLSIDQILFRQKLDFTSTGLPNRISPNAAASFMFVGGALLLLDVKFRRLRPAQSLALISSVIPLLALVGYAYGVQSFYGFASFVPLSLNAAIGFLALSIGVLFARPDVGLAPLFSSDTAGGIVVRRLLPIAIALPILLGWLRVIGQRAGIYSTEFGTALEAVTYIIVFATIVYWNARLLHRTDFGRAQAERALHRRTAELEAANKELEAFSYSVSHDLRAPLRSINGFSQALIEDYSSALDDGGKDHLRRVCQATERMSALIDDLLDLSRVTRSEMHKEELDLSAIAKSVAEHLRQEDASRRVEFVIADGLKTRGDTRLLRIVMENLMGNAWKYSSKHDRARIEFGSNRENGHSTYFLRDDGAGFDSQYGDRLFAAFQRLHKATEFPGTGIGLATVQRIVQRHGGRVWAEGAVEKGATFYFTLGVD